jgi:hypothetical protein
LKLGARVVEMTSRVRLAFAAACPDATLIGRTGDRLLLLGVRRARKIIIEAPAEERLMLRKQVDREAVRPPPL